MRTTSRREGIRLDLSTRVFEMCVTGDERHWGHEGTGGGKNLVERGTSLFASDSTCLVVLQ